MNAVVIGAGAWGTAFARLLAERGHDVTLVARDPEQARAISETGRNPKHLPEIRLDGIGPATLEEAPVAAKNVIALAAGGVDGLELGDNAKTAIVTRGLAEMARLGEAAGGRSETFAGLAGIGDLIVTCWSRHGRNRRAGELIARGASPEDAAAQIGTVEGLTTAPVLRELSERVGVEMPITNAVCDILGGRSLDELIAGLMGRRPTAE